VDQLRRLGLLGGTFDPVHVGHLVAAVNARHELTLDRVLLVVANEPWQKAPTRPVSPAEVRFEMTAAAVVGHDGLEASRLEIERGGPSYTVETAEGLVAEAVARGVPAPELFLLVGADLVGSLATWCRPEELARLVTLAVVTRPGSEAAAVPPGWRAVQVSGPGVDVSSSEVRALVAKGRPLDGLVPPAVVRCIRRHGLYAVGR